MATEHGVVIDIDGRDDGGPTLSGSSGAPSIEAVVFELGDGTEIRVLFDDE